MAHYIHWIHGYYTDVTDWMTSTSLLLTVLEARRSKTKVSRQFSVRLKLPSYHVEDHLLVPSHGKESENTLVSLSLTWVQTHSDWKPPLWPRVPSQLFTISIFSHIVFGARVDEFWGDKINSVVDFLFLRVLFLRVIEGVNKIKVHYVDVWK
jgi:hypothetical protein